MGEATAAGEGQARPYIRPLTSLRGIAALLVAVFHVYPFVVPEIAGATRFFGRGYLWVDLFFVLSGFVLGRTHGAEFREVSFAKLWRDAPTRGALWRFLQKRLARIYPMHAFVLVVLALCRGLIAVGVGEHVPFLLKVFPWSANWGEFTRTALLVQAWGFETHNAWNLPSWSISVEWALYLLFPLGVGAFSRSTPGARLGSLVACALGVLAFALTHSSFDVVFDGNGLLRAAPEFFLGLCLALWVDTAWFARGAAFLGRDVVFALLVLVILGLLCAPVHDGWVVALFPCLILAAFTARGRMGSLLSTGPVHWLGLVSYSIYMLHLPVLLFARALGVDGQGPLAERAMRLVLVLAALVALSGLTYPLIEVRARRWLQPRSRDVS
jgi:peptidoglycan/LPS O-acetylase OafA/YrhL